MIGVSNFCAKNRGILYIEPFYAEKMDTGLEGRKPTEYPILSMLNKIIVV